MQNIFIAHTPFHVFIAEKMVRDVSLISECKNILLLEMNSDFEHFDSKLWSEIQFLENLGGTTLGRNRYIMSEKNILTITRLLDCNLITNLYMSDIAWPMNNRIFFDRILKSKVQYSLFSDGLGTYASPKVTLMLFLRGIGKALNGYLSRGVRYTNYLGSQFGLDRNEIRYIYAPKVELIDCEEAKKKEISFDTMKIGNFDKNKCLFLDTPSWLETNPTDWNLICETALTFLKSLGVTELYYKNHYLGRKNEELFFKSHGFKIIETSKCAEQIVAENNFGIAVSYLSSSLFNLKCMYNEKIRCISLFSKTISLANGHNQNTTNELVRLYNDANVEIAEIV